MKLALISGGSRGLGAALCAEYRARGFQVLEYSRSAPHPWSVRCDFNAPETVEKTLLRSLSWLNETPESLVVISNAATLAPMGRAGSRPASEVATNLAINFSSAIVFMNTALRRFAALPCDKTIASISSGAALKPLAGWSLYCAAKAGLEHFVRTIATEQADKPHPFRVVNVDPGVMDTDMQAAIRASSADDFPAVDRFIERQRAGELRAPEDVAARIATLLSSPFETGDRRSAVDTNG